VALSRIIVACLIGAVSLTCVSMAWAGGKTGKVFPYAYTIDDLPNGLRVVTIPTEFPDLVSLYIVVQTGSRNEVEAGKSGYAHLFEHLMFRGSENYTAAQRDEILKKAGASSNAYTSDDRTVYHIDFAKEDFDQVIKLEADAFQRLKYDEAAYKTETLAVLGEYNKNSANPISKLFETLRATAYTQHTYAHTTMGFIKDIEDMPNQYQYSWQFYNRYYRPEYTTIVVVGDIAREKVLASVKKEFGDWKRGDWSAKIATEPAQTGPKEASVEWPTETLPWVAVAFRAPGYSDTSKEKPALDLLADIAFGENSDVYKKLVIQEQKADLIGVSYDNRVDPYLFTVLARVKKTEDVAYVRDQILATVERYKKDVAPQAIVDATRSRQRYGFLLALDSSSAIAENLAPFISLRRTPDTIEKVYATYDAVTPEDIRAAAQKYLVENSRTIVTLDTKAAPSGAKEGAK
jgi:zinc protease